MGGGAGGGVDGPNRSDKATGVFEDSLSLSLSLFLSLTRSLAVAHSLSLCLSLMVVIISLTSDLVPSLV